MQDPQDCFESRNDGSLNILIQRAPLQDSCCHTVHLALACPSATDYSPRESYQAVKAWFCGQPASQSAGIRRCARHWFSQFVCYAADQQPVAIANTSTQLAQLLSVPAVFLLDAESRQPLETSGWVHSAPAAATQAQVAGQAETAAQQQQQTNTAVAMEVEPSAAAGQYVADTLSLEVPAPQGNWTANACAALFVVLDIDSAGRFQSGQQYPVSLSRRCGNEAGKQIFCARHRKAAHVCLLAKNSDVLWAGSTLPELAAILGIASIALNEPLGDLASKLAASSAATTASEDGQLLQHQAAPAKQQQDAIAAATGDAAAGGASSSNSAPNAALAGVAGVLQPAGTTVKPAVLRLHLNPAQQAQHIKQQPTKASAEGFPHQQQQQHADQMSQLHRGYADVHLAASSNTRIQHPCLGLNLRLAVNSVQQLAASRGPVLVADGRRCGHEGGHKRCCRQHRAALVMMTDLMGNTLPGAANLEGLASMIKVSSVEVLDSITSTPLPEYQQLPPAVRWQVETDSSCFRIWLPHDGTHTSTSKAAAAAADAAVGAGSSSSSSSQQGDQTEGPAARQQQQPGVRQAGAQCAGLDFIVALQQGQTHKMGSCLPVLQVMRCGNIARSTGSSSTSACRRHQAGLLHLLPQGPAAAAPATAPFQMCKDLAELAIWLGVKKVEVLDSDTGLPVCFYKSLAPAPLQLSMPSQLLQQQQQMTHLTPPSLQVQPPQGWSSGSTTIPVPAAAAAAATDPGSIQRGTVAAATTIGNCRIEPLLPADGAGSSSSSAVVCIQGLVIKVPVKPVGPCNQNPCRALDVTVALTNGQSVWKPGETQCEIVSVQRCANEAGNKSRCRSHNETAVKLWAILPGITLQQQQQQQAAASLLAKLGSSADLAHQLGVDRVIIQCQDSGEDLGDVSVWSPSNDKGTAAKMQPAAAAAAAGTEGDETATAGPAVALPAALQAALGSVCLPGGVQVTSQQQQQAAEGSALDTAVKAAAAAAAASMPPDTSRLGLYQSCVTANTNALDTAAAAAATAAAGAEVPPAAGLASLVTPLSSVSMQQAVAQSDPAVAAPLVLHSSGLAAAIAAGSSAGWAPAAETTPIPGFTAGGGSGGFGGGAGFSTSAPLARLANLFPAPKSGGR